VNGGFFNFVQLTKPIRYTLGKTERLKSRKLIGQLFDEGKALTVTPFRILYRIEPKTADIQNSELQAAFSVSAKNFKKAVDRNRIKRLLREAYRLQKHILSEQLTTNNQQLIIFFIYTGKEMPEHILIVDKMQLGLKKLTEQIGKAVK
jgi:ribonuclease P protein component